MRNKYNIKKIRQLFKERDFVLLSKEYKRNNIKLDYICSCGNTSKISLTVFLRGATCQKCSLMRVAKFNKKRLKCKTNHHMYGKKHSEETKQKIGIGNKGKTKGRKCKKRTAEHCKKLSLSHINVSGKNNPNWKGGISAEHYPFSFCKELRELIRIRDNHTCQNCGKPENELRRQLNVHHINYNKHDVRPHNLVSLCDSCHSKTNFNRKKWIKKLSVKTQRIENKNMEMVLHDVKYLIQGIKKVRSAINDHEKVKALCCVLLDTTDNLFSDILKMSDKPKQKSKEKRE